MEDKNKGFFGKIHAQRFVMQVLIIVAAIVIDQLSKHWIMSTMIQNETRSVIDGLFSLTYIHNEGASFGIFQGKQLFFIIATAITLVGLTVYMVKARKKQGAWLRVCLSLIFAGAVGNFIDRIQFGYVRDFLDFSGLYFPFIFNVADMCLVVGSIMLGIYILFMHKEKDGKTLFARRDKNKGGLLEGDEEIDSEDKEPQTEPEAAEKEAEKKPQGGGATP